jgi:CheY-like chemotaxis protein
MLARLGWAVDEVRDGQEAVEQVQAAPSAYAAAVLDVRMPRLGGLAAARRLAELAPALPVVLISGYAEDAGVLADVLEKPFGAAALGERLRALIDRVPAVPAGA